MNSEMKLNTKNLLVGYNKKVVIDDINISIEAGKITTLIGANGSGKSTILKTITQQLKKIGGDIYIQGKSLHDMKSDEIARMLSMVMTDRIRAERMTCRDVVSTGRYPYTGKLGILTKDDWEIVDKSIAIVHAEEVAASDFHQISDGQKQRIMLARALCQEPEILILDEPTSYLDMRFKLDILTSIRKLARERNIAVITSLHEVDLAYKISDQIICVENGRLGRVGKPEELIDDNYVQNLYGIEQENFDSRLGVMYFPKQCSTPEVFVIAGGGTGILEFYRLQREGIPFSVGILAENDIDYSVASHIASEVISSPAFEPIGERQLTEAKKQIDACEYCICTLENFGTYNKANEELASYARRQGKLK